MSFSAPGVSSSWSPRSYRNPRHRRWTRFRRSRWLSRRAMKRGALPRLFAALDRLDYPDERLFIVLVEDGSVDATGPQLARWAAKRPRSRIVLHAHAGGKAVALNTALAAAPPSEIVAVCGTPTCGRGAGLPARAGGVVCRPDGRRRRRLYATCERGRDSGCPLCRDRDLDDAARDRRRQRPARPRPSDVWPLRLSPIGAPGNRRLRPGSGRRGSARDRRAGSERVEDAVQSACRSAEFRCRPPRRLLAPTRPLGW